MIQAIHDFLISLAEISKDTFIPIFIFFTLVYLCGYVRQKLIFAKKMNKFYDAYVTVFIEEFKKEMEKEQNEKITKIKPVKN